MQHLGDVVLESKEKEGVRREARKESSPLMRRSSSISSTSSDTKQLTSLDDEVCLYVLHIIVLIVYVVCLVIACTTCRLMFITISQITYLNDIEFMY